MGSFPRTDRYVMRYTRAAERGGLLERKTYGDEHGEHPSGFRNALTIGGRPHELHRSAPVFSIRCDAGSGTQIGGTLGFADRGGTMSMKIVNWNVRWATPRSKHSAEILSRIAQHAPELVCLTETHSGLLRDGHTIRSRPDYGYGIQETRRKVLLWSREPWDRVDDIGDERMPPGRFVSGVTRTSVGEVTVVGLCIPWSGSRAGARYSGERRRVWEDHESYLEHLAGVLGHASSKRLVVMGDFNQRIGETSGQSSRRGYGKAAHRAALLRRAIPPHVTLPTAGLSYCGRSTIDHIGLSADLAASLDTISNVHGERLVSDHFGVFADVSSQGI